MKCGQCRRLLPIYRELERRERASIDAHLAACQACAARLRAYQEQDRLLTALPRIAAPAPTARFVFGTQLVTARWHKGLAMALALALLLGGMGLTVRASTDALPGESFYGVKRAIESVRRAFTVREQDRLALDEMLAERRRHEAREMQRLAQSAEVEFDGIVETVAGEMWTVAGVRIRVPSEVAGRQAVGQQVHVTARATAGQFVALTVYPRAAALDPGQAPAEGGAGNRPPHKGTGASEPAERPAGPLGTLQASPTTAVPLATHTPPPTHQEPQSAQDEPTRPISGTAPALTTTPARQAEPARGPTAVPERSMTPRLPAHGGDAAPKPGNGAKN